MGSEQVLAQRRRLVAFRKALDLLYQLMHSVLYCCIMMAIKLASKVCAYCILYHPFVDCHSGLGCEFSQIPA